MELPLIVVIRAAKIQRKKVLMIGKAQAAVLALAPVTAVRVEKTLKLVDP